MDKFDVLNMSRRESLQKYSESRRKGNELLFILKKCGTHSQFQQKISIEDQKLFEDIDFHEHFTKFYYSMKLIEMKNGVQHFF